MVRPQRHGKHMAKLMRRLSATACSIFNMVELGELGKTQNLTCE